MNPFALEDDRFHRRISGFTLVELLVVITIIGILIALLLPAVQAAREAARRMQCANNLKQIGLALHNYHATHKMFPPGSIHNNSGSPFQKPEWISYLHQLLPYMEQQHLYDRTIMVPHHPWALAWPADVQGVSVPGFLCPSDGKGGPTYVIDPSTLGFGSPNEVYRSNYMGFFSGLNDGFQHQHFADAGPSDQHHMFRLNQGRKISEILDGTSNTMAISEYLTGKDKFNMRGQPFTSRAGSQHLYPTLTPNSSSPDILWGTAPEICENGTGYPALNLPCIGDTGTMSNYASPRSRHPGGVHVLLCDGSVRFVSDNVDLLSVWRPLATIANGEIIGEF